MKHLHRDQNSRNDKIMCGIVGYIGDGQAADIILDALKRLEYRGYDSAGVFISDGTKQQITKEFIFKESLVLAENGGYQIKRDAPFTNGQEIICPKFIFHKYNYLRIDEV